MTSKAEAQLGRAMLLHAKMEGKVARMPKSIEDRNEERVEQALELLSEGLSEQQIAYRLRRSREWVRKTKGS